MNIHGLFTFLLVYFACYCLRVSVFDLQWMIFKIFFYLTYKLAKNDLQNLLLFDLQTYKEWSSKSTYIWLTNLMYCMMFVYIFILSILQGWSLTFMYIRLTICDCTVHMSCMLSWHELCDDFLFIAFQVQLKVYERCCMYLKIAEHVLYVRC